MGKNKVLLYPQVEKRLADMGERIKLARLRRKLPVDLVAERAKVSRSSVWKVEKGSPSISMGIYVAVLMAIGLLEDIDLIAKDDILGKTLQDLELPVNKRVRRKNEE